MAYKVFSNGDALTGSELNTYLMNQSVMVFATAAARDAALTTPSEGMVVWLQDSDKYVYYTGSAWADLVSAAGSGNAIINGAFDIWQRGTSFSGSNDLNVWTADRFRAYIGSGGSLTASQQTFTPGTAPVAGYEGAYFLRVAKTAVNTGFALDHFIEDVRTFAGQTVTFSFWAKADASVSITPKFWQGFGSGGSSSVITDSTAVTVTTSWTRHTITFAVPSVSGKTIGTGSFLAIRIWDFTDSAAHTIDLWGLQLESGSTATAFKRNASNIQGELAACQRYYFRSGFGSGGNFTRHAIGNGFSSTKTDATIWLPTAMRSAPSSIDYSTLATYDGANVRAITVVALTQSCLNTATIEATVASGITTGAAYQVMNNNSTSGFLGFSAEL